MNRFNAGNVRLARESARWATLLVILLLVPGLAASSARAEESMVLRDGWMIQSSEKAGASGEQISRAGFDVTGWYKTSVPKTVVAALATTASPYRGTLQPPRTRGCCTCCGGSLSP